MCLFRRGWGGGRWAAATETVRDGGLGVLGELEGVVGALEDEPGDGKAEGGVGLVEGGVGDGVVVVEVGAHALWSGSPGRGRGELVLSSLTIVNERAVGALSVRDGCSRMCAAFPPD